MLAATYHKWRLPVGTMLTNYFAGNGDALPKSITVDAIAASFADFQSRINTARMGRDRAGVAACLVMLSDDMAQSQLKIVDAIAERLSLDKKHKSYMKGAFLAFAKRFNPQGDNPSQEAVVLSRELSLARGFTSSGDTKPGHCPRTGSFVGEVETTPKKAKDESKAPSAAKVTTGNQVAKGADDTPETVEAQSTLSITIDLLNALTVLQQRAKDGDAMASTFLTELSSQDLVTVDADNMHPEAVAA